MRDVVLVGVGAVLAFAAGCGTDHADLAVDLKTDLTPGVEFVAVRATLSGVGRDDARTVAALLPDGFEAGRRIAEYAALTPGNYTLTTDLLDVHATVVVRRTTLLTLDESLAITVLVSRGCRGVTCPAPGDPPERTTCSGTRCVDPRCSDATPELCMPDCTAASDCAPRAACASATCDRGVCLYLDDGSCGASARCDPDVGCTPLPGECAPPLARCGTGAATTCVDTASDPANCGRCGNACTAPADAVPTCGLSGCGFSCVAGHYNCDGACATTPCATALTTAGMTTYHVPAACTTLAVRAWGAGAGEAQGGSLAAAGGFAFARVDVTPGEDLTVVVAGPGGTSTSGAGGSGGVPGGGAGGTAGRGGGGGGGFSGVFRGAMTQANALVIAGGGGGPGAGTTGSGHGGAGGGATGEANVGAGAGGPGTQTAGGAGGAAPATAGTALMGGIGGPRSDGGGGGGGGYFGGGGGQGASTDGGGGGGGSGYANGRDVVLITGQGTVPANADDPDRGTAGSPGRPGAVFLSCE